MIVLAQAVWRDVTSANAMAVSSGSRELPERVHHLVNVGDALIERSRSVLATRFLEEPELADADVLVFVDSDITFEPVALAKVVEGARETGDVYGGIYVTRSREPHSASLALDDGREWRFEPTSERRPHEVRYLATGFMAIPRPLLSRMALTGTRFEGIHGKHWLVRYERGTPADACWDFFRTFGVLEDGGVAHWLSEDWAFCERSRQMGHKVWADESIILGHEAAITLTVADLSDTAAPASGAAVNKVAIPWEPHPLPSGLNRDPTRPSLVPATRLHPLVRTLPTALAAFLAATPAEVGERMRAGMQEVADLWVSRPPAQSVAEWYRRDDVGDGYMMDLAQWHQRGVPDVWLEAIGNRPTGIPRDRTLRVLDFGAGIGTLALMLAHDAGWHVRTYEPNAQLAQFIAWRAEREVGASRGHVGAVTEGEWTGWAFAPPAEPLFDLIVATHVLEHLETAHELTATLANFAAVLAPGGLVFYENDWTVDELHPQHFDHAAAFLLAVDVAGLTMLDDHWLAKPG